MSSALPVGAQTVGVWPEVDVFVRLNSTARLLLVATTVQGGDREDGRGVWRESRCFPQADPAARPSCCSASTSPRTSVLMTGAGYRYLPSYSGRFSGEPRAARGDCPVSVDGVLWPRAVVESKPRWTSASSTASTRGDTGTGCRSSGNSRSGPSASIPIRGSRCTTTAASPHSAGRKLMVGASFPISKYWELEGYFDYQLDTGTVQIERQTRSAPSPRSTSSALL